METAITAAAVQAADPGVALDAEFAERRRTRMRQVCVVLALGLAAGMVASAANNDWMTLSSLGGGLGFVAVSAAVNERGRTAGAAVLMLWALTVMATAVMALNQGPYSPAVLIYPCVLVVCSMTAGTRPFAWLLAAMLTGVAALTAASVSGFFDFSTVRYGVAQGVYTAIVILSCAAAVHLLGGDLRQSASRLRAEVDALAHSQARLDYLAGHDMLTALPNRSRGRERLQSMLAQAAGSQQEAALLFVDIDNFRTVNDTLGHAAGDALLVACGERLARSLPAGAEIARHGADQFVLLMPGAGATAASTAAGRVLRAMTAEPFAVAGSSAAVTCSIGVTLFPGDGDDADVLLKKAAVAVQHAKDAGRNTFRFFDAAMNTGMIEDLSINTELKLALQRGELQLHFQPVQRLVDGVLVGCEALLRWDHPERGLIPPDRFIPVAERSGLIVDIGDWVIDHACRQIAVWQATPLAHLVVAVNTSALQFKRGTIDGVVAQALQRHGAPPGRLEVEITESALIHDAEALVAVLNRLKALGVRLAIDDFGTGYSNLSYLQRFDVDKLKIDRSFVRRLGGSRQDAAIVQAIVQMAHTLQLATTAEGIEDAATLDALRDLGCDLGQGWLFGRPMLPAAFERHCADRRSCYT